MEQLKIFENEEFGQIRTVMRDGEVWFVGKDVAEALGFTNSRDAIATHVFDDDKGVEIIDTLGGKQKMTAINESGLYALVFGSRLESAKRFKRWVTSEVLPAIRKTGSYDLEDLSPEMRAIFQLARDQKKTENHVKGLNVHVGDLDGRVDNLENCMTIDYGEQVVLGDEVNKAVLDALGGKHSNAYNEIGKKVFAECKQSTHGSRSRRSWQQVRQEKHSEKMDRSQSRSKELERPC